MHPLEKRCFKNFHLKSFHHQSEKQSMITFFQRKEIQRHEIFCLQTLRSPEAALGLKSCLTCLPESQLHPLHRLPQWMETVRQPERARLCWGEANTNHSPWEGPPWDTLQTSCLRAVQCPQTARSNKPQWKQRQRQLLSGSVR